MTVFLILFLFITALNTFFFIRNEYTRNVMLDATWAIYNYNLRTITSGSKPIEYNEVLYKYDVYLFLEIARWGRYSAVKDQYQEMLKPYFSIVPNHSRP
jgi:hypothetical protein